MHSTAAVNVERRDADVDMADVSADGAEEECFAGAGSKRRAGLLSDDACRDWSRRRVGEKGAAQGKRINTLFFSSPIRAGKSAARSEAVVTRAGPRRAKVDLVSFSEERLVAVADGLQRVPGFEPRSVGRFGDSLASQLLLREQGFSALPGQEYLQEPICGMSTLIWPSTC